MSRRLIAPLFAFLIAFFCAALAGSAASAQDLKFEKYKLDNGMTVILHEDHSLPVAAINLWYRVGSKDEPAGRSGFAHLFEHLMFMGTQRAPGSAFDDLMEAQGGANNASTSNDRTNYFASGPARLLPLLLWLEADRLEDLGRTTTQAKLDKQRDVVRNERRQSYENRPYGKADLRIPELMYPVGHPYHIPVIGTHADLEAATVSDVKDFFATFYTPSNVSLCVAGDFKTPEIKTLIATLFGSLPRGFDPPRAGPQPASLDRALRLTLTDQVQLPMLSFVFHSPAQFADGDAEMDLLASILTEGKTSRLYKRLVYQDKVAVEVSADQDSNQLASMFRIDVLTPPDADLDRVEKTMDEVLAELAERGPSHDELARQQARVETAKLSELQSVENRADQLNEYEYFFGDPGGLQRDLDRYRKATPDGVRAWARRVLRPDARLIVRVLPEDRPEEAKSSRDEKPPLAQQAAFAPAAPQMFKLANGIPVLLWRKPELPLAAVDVIVRPGRSLVDPASAGLAYLSADMLGEGAGERDALQFSDAVQALGATFSTDAEYESASASIFVLKRSFDPAVALLADAVRRPRFDEKEWERVKRIHLESLHNDDDNPGLVARRVAARSLFGAGSPFGWPVDGTPESVEPLTLDAARKLHGEIFQPQSATILIAGDITAEEARSSLERCFGDWKASATAAADAHQAAPAHSSAGADASAGSAAAPKSGGPTVRIVHRPDAVQTVVLFIMPAPHCDDARRVPLRLTNVLLGSSFTSRLNQNLREKHGYTYGARSGFVMRPSVGWFTAAANVQAKVTGASVREFLNELRGIRAGNIRPDELTKARETMRTDVTQSFAGLSGILAEAGERVSMGLPFESLGEDLERMSRTTVDELNKLSRDAVPLEQSVLVLVGDRTVILPQLADLGLPAPQEVDVRGEPVSGAATGAAGAGGAASGG